MVRSRVGTWFGAAALALMTVGCSQSDPGVTTAVKSKLAADDTVKAYRIDVDTKDRVVTLSGAVDTASAKARAVELAKNTEGVTEVVDRLTVTPGVTPTTGVDDAAAAKAGESAREADAKTDRAQDKTAAAAGRASDSTKDAAARASDSTKSAGGRVANAAGDAAITAAIKTKFLADDTIPGTKIDVDTNNNVVTLSGVVRTAAEKTRALQMARQTEGVKSVVDKLKVQ